MPAAPAKKANKKTDYQRRKGLGRRMLTVEIPVKTYERLHDQAAKADMTGAAIVRVALEEHLDKRDAQEAKRRARAKR